MWVLNPHVVGLATGLEAVAADGIFHHIGGGLLVAAHTGRRNQLPKQPHGLVHIILHLFHSVDCLNGKAMRKPFLRIAKFYALQKASSRL